MKKNIRILLVIIITTIIILLFNSKVNAVAPGLSINKSSAYVGDSFRVTISGINGRVNISGSGNISISPSGSQFVDGSLTISGTAKSVGTGTVTVTPVDASTTAAEPVEVTQSASRSITISQKPVEPPKTETKPAETKKTETKTTTTTKTTEKKQEEKSQEDDFYITSLTLKGIKENEEKVDITLSPEFKKDVYEYTAVVPGDIVKLDIQKDAGKYNNSIIIEGGEQLKVGENIITLQLSAEDHKAKVYRIKVTKEELKEEIEEPIQEIKEEYVEKEEKEPKIITMPLWAFLLIQAGVIILEVIGILIAFKIKNSRSGDIASERLRKWR